jgi:glycine cleavage system H protein
MLGGCSVPRQASRVKHPALKTLLIPVLFHNLCSLKKRSMNIPDNLRYTKEHEWISLKGNIATIGITDFAQSELGDIVFVEIETAGKALQAGDTFGTVEAVKTVSDLFLPVSGTVNEVNPALSNTPEVVNSDPYGQGWMIRMTVDNPAEVEQLMDAAAYQALVH